MLWFIVAVLLLCEANYHTKQGNGGGAVCGAARGDLSLFCRIIPFA